MADSETDHSIETSESSISKQSRELSVSKQNNEALEAVGALVPSVSERNDRAPEVVGALQPRVSEQSQGLGVSEQNDGAPEDVRALEPRVLEQPREPSVLEQNDGALEAALEPRALEQSQELSVLEQNDGASEDVGALEPRLPEQARERSVSELDVEAPIYRTAMFKQSGRFQTRLVNMESEFDPYGASSTPIYQTATFKQPSATEKGEYDYTRSGNPTRDTLERHLAKIEKADRAFCFTSGMAALSAVVNLVETGQEIVAGIDIYGGSYRLLSHVTPKSGIVVRRVNTSDLDEVDAAIGDNTKLVWLESPTNPRQQIANIRRISEIAHAKGALVLVDNSIMSPVLSLPLKLGAGKGCRIRA